MIKLATDFYWQPSFLLGERSSLSENIRLGWKWLTVINKCVTNTAVLETTVFYWVNCAYKYSAHLNFTVIFGQKEIFLFFKNNLTRINYCKFVQHKSHLKSSLSYLPCIVCREYFSIIFNIKKCALYLIKYSSPYFFSNPSSTFASNNVAYLRGALRWIPNLGSRVYIRLGWKWLAVTNTPAYNYVALLTNVKKLK